MSWFKPLNDLPIFCVKISSEVYKTFSIFDINLKLAFIQNDSLNGLQNNLFETYN